MLDQMLAELERNLETVLKALEGAKAEMDAAVAAEREACALIADQLGCCGQETARKIRARAGVVNSTPLPDSITTDSFEVRWMGDSLTESPGAMAILESVPPGFRLDPELEAFYAGEQWDLKIRADRDAAGRPTLTLNMLPRLVAMAIEKHLATPGARQLNSIDREFLRLYITLRNRDAQRAFNYMTSAALEASRGKEGEGEHRIVSPDELGRAVHTAHKSIYSDEKYWQNLGFAAINYYLKQPKVSV